MGVGFVIPGLWVVSLLGTGIFLHLLLTQSINRQLLFGAVLAFTVKYLFSASIFWSTYPVNFLPFELGFMQLFIIFIYWLTSSLWLGLGASVLVFARWVWDKFYSDYVNYWLWPIIALLWVGAEILGSFVFSIMTIGDGSYLNIAYSLGYSGYLLAEHDLLIQLSKLFGVYGLSLFFVALAGFGYFLVKRHLVPAVIFLCFLLFISSDWFWDNNSSVSGLGVVDVMVIDTNFASGEMNDASRLQQRQSLLKAVEVALNKEPDYLLLPEDAGFFLGTADENQNLKTKYENTDTTIIDSRTVMNGSKLNLEAYIYEGQTQQSSQIAKRYLVPQGEYMPYLYTGLFKLFGQDALVEYMEDYISYTVGDYTSQRSLGKETPAILFCFESFDPTGIKQLMQERPSAPFVAHPVSHAWFNQSEILWHQLDSMLRVQSLWSGVHIVTASNQGRSQVYTPTGKILDMEEIVVGKNWSLKKISIDTR